MNNLLSRFLFHPTADIMHRLLNLKPSDLTDIQPRLSHLHSRRLINAIHKLVDSSISGQPRLFKTSHSPQSYDSALNFLPVYTFDSRKQNVLDTRLYVKPSAPWKAHLFQSKNPIPMSPNRHFLMKRSLMFHNLNNASNSSLSFSSDGTQLFLFRHDAWDTIRYTVLRTVRDVLHAISILLNNANILLKDVYERIRLLIDWKGILLTQRFISHTFKLMGPSQVVGMKYSDEILVPLFAKLKNRAESSFSNASTYLNSIGSDMNMPQTLSSLSSNLISPLSQNLTLERDAASFYIYDKFMDNMNNATLIDDDQYQYQMMKLQKQMDIFLTNVSSIQNIQNLYNEGAICKKSYFFGGRLKNVKNPFTDHCLGLKRYTFIMKLFL